jgi:general secretion pathway protein K
LRKVAAVWPSQGKTPVNINTASKEVLMSLAPNIPQADVEAIISTRESEPYTSVNDIINDPLYADWAKDIDPSRLSTTSTGFIVTARAHFGGAAWKERILLARSGGNTSVMYRKRLTWMD